MHRVKKHENPDDGSETEKREKQKLFSILYGFFFFVRRKMRAGCWARDRLYNGKRANEKTATVRLKWRKT